MFDISTVLAGGGGVVVLFALIRGFIAWKRWSNLSKSNDEIDMDKTIADAIKSGDVQKIAKLRKYFLIYQNKK